MAQPDRSSTVMVELLRLGIVVLLTAVGFALGDPLAELLDDDQPERARLLSSLLGALVGYLLGGVAGRALVRSVDHATRRFAEVPAMQLVAAAIGAGAGVLLGTVVLLPVLLLPGQRFTVPLTLLVLVALAYTGTRLGASKGADLGRFVGVRGRLDVRSAARGGGVKVIDSSALIDARLVEVARAGFLEGTLVVPAFVLREVQRLADADEPRRRALGRRGLDAAQVLTDENLVAVEVTDEDPPGADDVDAKLVVLTRERRGVLVTTDSNLEQVAEISGLRVLNLHALADAVRAPVLPGDRIDLRIIKPGKEPGQGIGYLDDGTMVVVDGAGPARGSSIGVEVTSIVQNRRGRMLFALPAPTDEATIT